MSETKIPPALTSEEWDEQFRLAADPQMWAPPYNPESSVDEDGTKPHAMAALCLYGQPFGFTREDVEWLRGTAAWWSNEAEMAKMIHGEGSEKALFKIEEARREIRLASSLADRIAALLPPE